MAYGTANVDVIQSSTTGTPVQFNDGSGAQIGTLCRAWVSYKGTATQAIRASFNVSSVTYNATGDYTINYSTAFSDNNYSFVGTTGTDNGRCPVSLNSVATYLAASTRIRTLDPQTSTGVDQSIVNAAVFR